MKGQNASLTFTKIVSQTEMGVCSVEASYFTSLRGDDMQLNNKH